MNTNMITMKLNQIQRGRFFKCSWASDVPVTAEAKRMGITVIKFTHATMRWGISYNNIQRVKDKKESGQIQGDGKLAWGQYKKGHEGVLIEHKGTDYVRLYTTPNKFQSTYFLNGRPIKVHELMELGYVQKSYWNRPDDKPDCLTIKCANIQDIRV